MIVYRDASLITVISLLFELWHFFFHFIEFLEFKLCSGVVGSSLMVDVCGDAEFATTMDQRRPRRSPNVGNSAIKLFSYSLSIK